MNARFPEAALSHQLHTNKLAVCLGDGSKYDKHYDNEGGSDLRKLTCLIYLQDEWDEACGGCFRMFADDAAAAQVEGSRGVYAGRAQGVEAALQTDPTSAEGFPAVDIAPLGGRLLCFWSDKMVHGVLPSFASTASQNRWALTVWLQSDDPSAISVDPEAEARHFVSS